MRRTGTKREVCVLLSRDEQTALYHPKQQTHEWKLAYFDSAKALRSLRLCGVLLALLES
jgi:hypothetical protein